MAESLYIGPWILGRTDNPADQTTGASIQPGELGTILVQVLT